MNTINILYCSGYDYVVNAIQNGQKSLREKGLTSFLFRYWGEIGKIQSEKDDAVIPCQFDIIILDSDVGHDFFASLIKDLPRLQKEKTLFLSIFGTQYLRNLGFKDLGCHYEQLADEISSFAM